MKIYLYSTGCIGLMILWCFVYSKVFLIQPYLDDLMIMSRVLHYGYSYVIEPYTNIFYRPFSGLFLAISFQLFDSHKFALGVNLISFLIGSFLLGRIVYRLFSSLTIASVCVIFYLFHSINTPALMQMDTLGQQFTNLFIFISIIWLMNIHKLRTSHWKQYLIGSLFFLFIFASKETAVFLGLSMPFLAVYFYSDQYPQAGRRKIYLVFFQYVLCVIFAFGLYMSYKFFFLNQSMGADSGRYTLNLNPMNIMTNMILTWGSVVYLGSSARVFIENFEINLYFVITVFFSLFIFSLNVYYILQILYQYFSKKYSKDLTDIKKISLILFLMLMGCFPAALIQRVSELYSYQVTPYYACLTAVSLVFFSQKIFRKPSIFIYLLMSLFVVISVDAIQDKIQRVIKTGQYNEKLKKAMLERVSQEEFKKNCRSNPERVYSVYSLSNELILKDLLGYLKQVHGIHQNYSCKNN